MDKIDLRSDTVTWPTEEMREAMANAVVGDDVFGGDPTVNKLEAETAELLGKEAALFVSSGTQGNLISVLAHCGRGDEIILGDKSHTFVFEAGGVAALGGVHPHTVPMNDDGTLDLDDIRAAIRGDNIHFPRTKLITLENTQNIAGGVSLSKEYSDQVADIAHENGLKLHIDGARIFNAAADLNISVKDLIEKADSMTFCLSKGLCAPVGSIIVGTADFIAESRRLRKMLGGGMRQAGVLAAAGLLSIHKMANRLHEDHENATFIGQELLKIPGIDVLSINTNFVFIELNADVPISGAELMQRMEDEHDVLLMIYPNTQKFRLVTHYWITRERAEKFVEAMRTLFS
jgi:threonine aldolase